MTTNNPTKDQVTRLRREELSRLGREILAAIDDALASGTSAGQAIDALADHEQHEHDGPGEYVGHCAYCRKPLTTSAHVLRYVSMSDGPRCPVAPHSMHIPARADRRGRVRRMPEPSIYPGPMTFGRL